MRSGTNRVQCNLTYLTSSSLQSSFWKLGWLEIMVYIANVISLCTSIVVISSWHSLCKLAKFVPVAILLLYV